MHRYDCKACISMFWSKKVGRNTFFNESMLKVEFSGINLKLSFFGRSFMRCSDKAPIIELCRTHDSQLILLESGLAYC